MKTFNQTTKITIGKYTFSQLEQVDWNNHKYSKSWHRQHGGVKEVSNRRVIITKQDKRAKNGVKTIATVNFDAWRGNILLTAIKESGHFNAPQSTAPLAVRLDKFYDAKVTRQIGKIKIYQRTLLNEHVDYCVVLNGVTFHAETILEAIKGVHTKIKAAVKKINEPISFKLCKDLGFCDAGIKAFCEAFGLSLKDTYSPQQIEQLVKESPNKAAPFEAELKTLAKALNYNITLV
jgi:hypothetical protein